MKLIKTSLSVLVFVLTVLPTIHAQDLSTLGEMVTALKDDLGFDSSVTAQNYPTRKLYRVVNRAINFIETTTKCREDRIPIVMTPNKFAYPLGDSISYNGVEGAYIVPRTGAIFARGLAIKPTVDLGKPDVDGVVGYEVVDHTVVLTKTPTAADTLYVNVFKESAEIGADSSTILMPRKYRELVLQYAYYLCLRSELRRDDARAEWEAFLVKFQLVTGQSLKQAEPLNPERS